MPGLAKRIKCRIFQTSTSEVCADAARTKEGVLGPRQLDLAIGLVVIAAFVLYWASSFALQARGATLHFGADAHLYDDLARGIAVDRVARFHPVTVALALSWMKLLSPLTHWITPQQLLKAMFAAVGAVGVWAAMAAFTIFFQRRYVVLWGIIYAASFGVWYFSSIEESKIVTASLTALYITVYLRLREMDPPACGTADGQFYWSRASMRSSRASSSPFRPSILSSGTGGIGANSAGSAHMP